MTTRSGRYFMGLLIAGLLALGTAQAASSSRFQFELEELFSGEVLTMELLTEGKPLVFHVWGPECPHCQRQMPYFELFTQKADPDEVNIVTCAMGANQYEALAYMDSKDLHFPVLLGNSGELGDGFTELGWPTTFVFAPGGTYVGWCDTQGPSYISDMLELVEEAKRR